jgi:hypothetical protein
VIESVFQRKQAMHVTLPDGKCIQYIGNPAESEAAGEQEGSRI